MIFEMFASRLFRSNTLDIAKRISKRCLAVPANQSKTSLSTKELLDFDPNNYSVPLRPVTMDDTMEPYGDWKVAYAAEKRRGNRMLLAGILSFSGSVLFLIKSGVFDPVIMPNLDNIMEETEPWNFDKEGRVTV